MLRRQRFGWYAYGWASHAFEAAVIRVFMSRYLPVVAENAVGRDGRLHVLGLPMLPGSLFTDVQRVAGTTDAGGGSPIAPLGSQRRAGAGQDHEGER